MASLISGIAQPSNDDCSSATPLLIAIDSASCVPIIGDTRNTQNAIDIEGPEVCSGSWYSDDVWYSIEIGNELPPNGVTIEVRLDPDSGTELTEHGLALYFNDCSSTSEPIDCFSDDPGRRIIKLFASCTEPNSIYLIRLWSAPELTTNSGTFSICAYATPPDIPDNEPMPRVIYEENFDTGLNGWTNMPLTEFFCLMAQEYLPADWIWSETGCIPNPFGGKHCIQRPGDICQESGIVGFPSGWYVNNKNPNALSIPPYPKMEAYLVSPSIDLSNEACVNLSWTELFRGLHGSDISHLGPTVEYSIDGGQNWIPPSPRINSIDVSINYGGRYIINGPERVAPRSIPLYGAEGNPDVKIRFGFKGDYYAWLIDEVKIIEASTLNLTSDETLISQATIIPMSIYQIDPINFHNNVTNSGCEIQTNVGIKIEGTNSNGSEILSESVAIDDLNADERTGNQYLIPPFIPEPEVNSYTFTYTTFSDEDNEPDDDTASFKVDLVDEMEFRKENGEVTGIIGIPGAGDWLSEPIGEWELGNIFFAPNANTITGTPLRFNKISFKLFEPSNFINDTLQIRLYKIQDLNLDSILYKDDKSEITLLSETPYIVSGNETNLVTVSLNPLQGDDNNLNIEANTNYMASIKSKYFLGDMFGPGFTQIACNNQIDYSLTNSVARENANGDPSKMRYTFGYSIGNQTSFRIIPIPVIGYNEKVFGENNVPIIRLGYEEIGSSSTSKIDQNTNLSISPNPAQSEISVEVLSNNATDMEVSILSITGQNILTKNYSNLENLKESFDISTLANGIYMLHVQTKDGIQTKKFVVSR